VVKAFDKVIGRTGLRDEAAREANFDAVTIETRTSDHKAYYPGANELRIRITGDPTTGRLVGAQLIGEWRAEVSKRLDVFAAALYNGMKVEEISELDLSYTPPLSSPWDPIQIAAQAWTHRKLST
jgi:NADPH-dependent 2,4-dienoyl-CoA reductase/sulfur reductase-like enzyme